jgi:hypothetical protein
MIQVHTALDLARALALSENLDLQTGQGVRKSHFGELVCDRKGIKFSDDEACCEKDGSSEVVGKDFQGP